MPDLSDTLMSAFIWEGSWLFDEFVL